MPPTKFRYALLNTTSDIIYDEEDLPANLKKYEVLVKVSACGLTTNFERNELNFSNGEKLKSRKYLGADVCGVVEKVGLEVKTLHAGDTVAGVIPGSYKMSGCGEYVVFEEYDLVRIEGDINPLDVAASVGDIVRAYIALFYCAKTTRDDTILIMNGAKPCSNMCLQLAHHINAKVLTTCSSSNDKVLLEACDSSIDGGIIDLSCEENISSVLYNECMKKSEYLGVDVVLDLESKKRPKTENGSLVIEDIVSCLTLHGRWVSCDEKLQLDPPQSQLLHSRCASLSFLNEQAWLMSKISQGKYQHIINAAMMKLKTNVIRPVPYLNVKFESLHEVLGLLHQENNINKIVVSIS